MKRTLILLAVSVLLGFGCARTEVAVTNQLRFTQGYDVVEMDVLGLRFGDATYGTVYYGETSAYLVRARSMDDALARHGHTPGEILVGVRPANDIP